MTKNPEKPKRKPRPTVVITRYMRAHFEGKLTKRNLPKTPGYTREE